MPTAGPYNLQQHLSTCEVGDVWSAADDQERAVTVAVLNERASVDERWRGAFAAAAVALSQAGADPLPILDSDHGTDRPWVACASERGSGAAQIFVALGQRMQPVTTADSGQPDPAASDPAQHNPAQHNPAQHDADRPDAGPSAAAATPIVPAQRGPAEDHATPGWAEPTATLNTTGSPWETTQPAPQASDGTQVLPAIPAQPAAPAPAGEYQPAAGPFAPAPPDRTGPGPGYPAPGYSDQAAARPTSDYPVSGQPTSGYPVSSQPTSGYPVSGQPTSGGFDTYGLGEPSPAGDYPYSGSGAPPQRSRIFGDQPPRKPRRTGLLVTLVALGGLLIGAAIGVGAMSLRGDDGGPKTEKPAALTPAQLLLPTTAPSAPGIEPPLGGGWPTSWPNFTSTEATKPMNNLAGVGFDFRIPPEWSCTEAQQAAAAVQYKCGTGTGSKASGGDLLVRACEVTCGEAQRTQLRQKEEAWGLRWTKSGPFVDWAETVKIDGKNVYGLVYVAFWRSSPEGPIDRELVLHLTAPLATSDDLKKVANSIRDSTFTL